jgi:DNA replication protein DnaC
MDFALNREVEEWGEVFPDAVLSNAIIDRIFDRAETVIFQGESYRLKGRINLPALHAPDIVGRQTRPGGRS